MRLLPILFAICLSLSACSEGNFRPVTKSVTEADIVIEYDQSALSGNRVMKVASDHCAQFGKKAELDEVWGGGWTMTLTKERWLCI